MEIRSHFSGACARIKIVGLSGNYVYKPSFLAVAFSHPLGGGSLATSSVQGWGSSHPFHSQALQWNAQENQLDSNACSAINLPDD